MSDTHSISSSLTQTNDNDAPQPRKHKPTSPMTDSAASSPPDQPRPVLRGSLSVRATRSAGRPFSSFSNGQKWMIVLLASLAGMFSAMASLIIVPSLPDLATDFGKSIGTINLSLTVYIIFQGIMPAFVASASDSIGRRPVMLSNLTAYAIVCVGLALTPTSSYGLFLFLRILQATAGAPLIALGNGCVADFATTAERGKFMGLFTGVAMFGPAIGPVLGGIINESLSWRYVFWVLAAWCGATAVMVCFTLPETLRSLVGDGTIPAPWQGKRPQELWRDHQRKKRIERGEEDDPLEEVERPPRKKYDPLDSFRALFQPDIACLLFFGGMMFGSSYAVLGTFSTFLQENYGFSSIKSGLCYLPLGFGSLLAAIFGGRTLDWDYKRTRDRLGFVQKHPRDVEGFPIERTRLHFLPISYSLMMICMIGYGWAIQTHSSFVIPLVINFIVGAGSQGSMQIVNCLLVDLYPQSPGAISASFNLTRCLLSAAVTAWIEPLYGKVGVGWALVITAGISIALSPLLLFIVKKGPEYRQRRLDAARAAEASLNEKRTAAA